jgi:hypothetical protein
VSTARILAYRLAGHVAQDFRRHGGVVVAVRLVQDLEDQSIVTLGEDVRDVCPKPLQDRGASLRLQRLLVVRVDHDVQVRLRERVVDHLGQRCQSRMRAIDVADGSIVHEQIRAWMLRPGHGDAHETKSLVVVRVDLGRRGRQRRGVLDVFEHLPEVHALAHVRDRVDRGDWHARHRAARSAAARARAPRASGAARTRTARTSAARSRDPRAPALSVASPGASVRSTCGARS